jgi:beta-carotene hydroxylase
MANYDTLLATNTLFIFAPGRYSGGSSTGLHGRLIMQKNDQQDLAALTAAKQYMGGFAWPTVALGLGITLAYVATPLLVLSGSLPLLPALLLMSVLTYAAYTVLHDAAHGSIAGSHRELRWLNELLGYMAAWVLMIPLTAHRHEHLAHHRNTNQQDDPDLVVADMNKSPWHAARAALQIFASQYRYYFKHRWSKAPRSQNVYFCLEIIAAIAPRLAFIAAGYWLEALLLFGVAGVIGIAILMYLFAYIVHTPHQSVGRYVDTSTFVIPGLSGKVMTLLWGYQNYHSIHHLFPRVPFYKYAQLFSDIEDIMAAKGAPIYTLQERGVSWQLQQ